MQVVWVWGEDLLVCQVLGMGSLEAGAWAALWLEERLGEKPELQLRLQRGQKLRLLLWLVESLELQLPVLLQGMMVKLWLGLKWKQNLGLAL